VDPEVADLVVAAISLAGLAASLGHVVKVFVGGGGKGVARLSGVEFGDA
jgi:glycerol-3-phosphate acyltransferase PlsY